MKKNIQQKEKKRKKNIEKKEEKSVFVSVIVTRRRRKYKSLSMNKRGHFYKQALDENTLLSSLKFFFNSFFVIF